jgi:diadenylate cyclase
MIAAVLPYWKTIVEVIILWVMIYHILLFFEGTRAVQVLRGIVILVVAFFVFQRLNFQVLDWLLTKLFGISVIAFLIIFHPEIRQGLARLGQRHPFSTALREEDLLLALQEVVRACESLIKDKIGALIAIEKRIRLPPISEAGWLLTAAFPAT